MKLSIAIPTYNRSDVLPYLLDSILTQTSTIGKNGIEIVISDNASTDATSSVVAAYAARHPGLFRYFKNDENVGYSRNVDLSIQHCNTKFVLLMSDDDALCDNALNQLIKVVKRHETDASIFFSNTIAYLTDMSRPDSECQDIVSEEQLFRNGIDYIKQVRSFPPALLSGYVIKRQDWVGIGNAKIHVKSIIVHMLSALEICLSERGVVMTGINLVKYRQNNSNTTASWGKSPLYPFRFYLDCLQGLKDLNTVCPSDVGKTLYNAAARTIVFYLIRQKVVDHPFDAKTFWKWFARVKNYQSIYTTMAYAVCFIPRNLLRMIFGRLVAKYPI